MRKLLMSSLTAAAVALALTVAAVGSPAAPTPVTVTAGKPSEFRFTLSKKTVAKGTVSFKVTNKGAFSHDFRIAGKKTKMLAAGKSQTLTVVFAKAGRYAYICTVPGHAAGGMKGTFTVK